MAVRLGLKPLTVILAVSMIFGLAAFDTFHRVAAVPLTKNIQAFPQQIGKWQSHGLPAEANILDPVKFDENLFRSYLAPDGARLSLSLGYFESQAQGKELVGYELQNVLGAREMPGSDFRRTSRPVNDFLTTNGRQTEYVAYWYTLNGKIVSKDYQAKLYTAWNAIVHGRSNGGIVVIKTPMSQTESVDVARLRIADFVEGSMNASGDLFR